MQPGKRPRVLHLITKGIIAGAEQLLVGLSTAHDQKAWDVRYGTLFPAGEMNERIEESGRCCYPLSFRSNRDMPRTAMQLVRLIRDQEIDILHTHLVHAGLAGILARRILGSRIRLVHTRHHSTAHYKLGESRFDYKSKIDGIIARQQDAVCAVSKTARDILIQIDRVRPERVQITHPGIDIDRFRLRVTDDKGARIRAELGVNTDQPLLGVVAHLVPKKGHYYLLQAMPEVLAHFPEARLILVGRGEECAGLEESTRRLGLEKSVIFAGYRADVPDILAALDLLVQPSLEEGLPVSIIEAMALAKPVVASAVSGIPEVVESGVTGLLVPPANPSTLAWAIIELLSNPEQRAEMGRLGEMRARECFTISRLARQYEAIWAQVLALPTR
jgi:glycosyltransferase involved in cell wall biosynthesis